MAYEPDQLRARRARSRATYRRRRLVALGVLGVLIAAIAGVAVAATGGSNSPSSPQANAGYGAVPAGAAPANVHPSLETVGYANIRKLIALGLPIYCAGPKGNAVAFTFDDGPGGYTHYAVKKLTQSGERATFFVVGRSMDSWPGWLPKELKVAAIGDHTYTHPELTALSPDAVTQQLSDTKKKIEAASGQQVVLWRPPYGLHSPTIDKIGQSLGMLEILWSTDSQDSLGAEWNGIIRNVEAGMHPGAIILMHENRGQTIRALTTLLPVLHARHLRSVSLPELFATDPPSPAQVRRGHDGCAGGAKVRASGS